MRDHVLDALANEGVLLEPEAADLVLSQREPLAFVHIALQEMAQQPLVLTLDDLRPFADILALVNVGLVTNAEMARFLFTLPFPLKYVEAALEERGRLGLDVPNTLTAEDLIIDTSQLRGRKV